jgi:hypothetical protein
MTYILYLDKKTVQLKLIPFRLSFKLNNHQLRGGTAQNQSNASTFAQQKKQY